MRAFFAVSLLAALSASASPIKRRGAAPTDDDILNYALTLEHLENAFYTGALAQFDEAAFTSAGFPAAAHGRFVQLAANEAAHVNFLQGVLGDKATQPCTYSFPYTDVKSFTALSQIFEGVGTSAYAGASKLIASKDTLTAAAVILSTEARHASWVASAVNGVEPWSGPFDVPLTLDEGISLASAFIVSCPSTNPTLPATPFPALTLGDSGETIKPGDTVTINYTGVADNDVVFFLSGLTQTPATVQNGHVTVPGGLRGTVYAVVSKAGSTSVSDDTTIAGPAILQFHFDPEGNLLFQFDPSAEGNPQGGM